MTAPFFIDLLPRLLWEVFLDNTRCVRYKNSASTLVEAVRVLFGAFFLEVCFFGEEKTVDAFENAAAKPRERRL